MSCALSDSLLKRRSAAQEADAPSLFGASPATDAELRRLIGAGTLDWVGYALLAFVVIAVAAICRITSRFGVYHILEAQNR